jgi:hypothetical protein
LAEKRAKSIACLVYAVLNKEFDQDNFVVGRMPYVHSNLAVETEILEAQGASSLEKFPRKQVS